MSIHGMLNQRRIQRSLYAVLSLLAGSAFVCCSSQVYEENFAAAQQSLEKAKRLVNEGCYQEAVKVIKKGLESNEIAETVVLKDLNSFYSYVKKRQGIPDLVSPDINSDMVTKSPMFSRADTAYIRQLVDKLGRLTDQKAALREELDKALKARP